MPVFVPMLSYLLWKARPVNRELNLAGERMGVDTRTAAARARTGDAIPQMAQAARMSAEDRNVLLEQLACELGLAYRELLSRRLLQIIKPDEVRSLSTRKSTSNSTRTDHREAGGSFLLSKRRARPRVLPWLEAEGIASAKICVPGLAHPSNSPLLLPRFIDTMQRSAREFEAWAAGIGALVSRRPQYDA